jgi:hypothetical protein
MKSQRVLSDVNLSECNFSARNLTASLEFLNMTDGAPIATCICHRTVLFHSHTLPDISFSVYVGEVDIAEIELKSEAESLLENLKYGWAVSSYANEWRPGESKLFHIHIEGGDVIVDIVCEDMQFMKTSM